MLYLHTQHLKQAQLPWSDAIAHMVTATEGMGRVHFSQPIKPYLDFEEPSNRIIAMPAYLGGDINACGLKWIASFPDNINHGIQRAHSNTVLNDGLTGKPIAFINSAYISGIRTAAVTGMVIQKLRSHLPNGKIIAGIAGFGPIGQLHLSMVLDVLGQSLEEVRIFDLRPINENLLPQDAPCPVRVTQTWQEAYADCDVFMTCTVAKQRWINLPPKPGSLQLNVSLRDYHAEIANSVDVTLVDDWDEINRANTDVEILHKTYGLSKQDTVSLLDLFTKDQIIKPSQTLMFHPMGLAIYDVILAKAYVQRCLEMGIGMVLPEENDSPLNSNSSTPPKPTLVHS